MIFLLGWGGLRCGLVFKTSPELRGTFRDARPERLTAGAGKLVALGGGQAKQVSQILEHSPGLGAIVLGQGFHEEQVESFQRAAELDGTVALGGLGELALGTSRIGIELTRRDLP